MLLPKPMLTPEPRPADCTGRGSEAVRVALVALLPESADLALRVLRCLAGLLQTGLLTLDDTGVAGQEAGLLQGRTVVLAVNLVQRAGDAQAQRTGLAGGAATVDACNDVVSAIQIKQLERIVDFLLVQLVREVVSQFAAVDGPVAGTGNDAHAGNSFLAAANSGTGNGQGRAFLGNGLRCLGAAFRGVAGEVLASVVQLFSILSPDSP